MDKFWELLSTSVIGRLTLALMFGATICYMYAAGKPVPDNLDRVMMVILGSLFQAAAGASYTRSQARKTQ